jgi:hypothetical protein
VLRQAPQGQLLAGSFWRMRGALTEQPSAVSCQPSATRSDELMADG